MIDYKKTGLKLLGFVAVCAVVLLSIGLGIYFWPFLIGILIAVAVERLVNFFIIKFKWPRKLVGTILVILVYLLIAGILALIVTALVGEAVDISSKIPTIYEESKIEYNAIYKSIIEFMDRTPSTISNSLYDLGLKLLGKVTEFATTLVNSVIDFIMFVPNIIIYVIITFLATLFLVTDRRTITRYLTDLLPNEFVKKVSNVIVKTFKSLGSYLKAMCIMICITFVELLIAFTILKQPYPLTLALVVAIVDALPILGTGTILIPWAIYSAITGNIGMGVGLLVVYLVITVVRQLIEPKVVSKNIGIHPFITLLAMYIGFKIFGLFGLIVGPVVMVIFKNVFETMFATGYFKSLFVYKKEKKTSTKTTTK
ncbi:MAG: sporulation integral membrane protein YtvI [Clostridia bacterium]|nr:sporulation integral membrane protein YtvI [Clostridia bacterium]